MNPDVRSEALSNLNPAEKAAWLSVYREVLDETGDGLKAELAAWGALKRQSRLKVVKSTNGRWRVPGWGMLFTGAQKRDLDKQFFDQATKTFLRTSGRALWYEHGEDPAYGVDPIGERVVTEVYPRGIWTEHELYSDHPQLDRTLQEINDGELSLSSDSILQYVEQGFDPTTGYLGVWPIAGWSLTKRPAEPGLGPVTLDDFSMAVKTAMAEAREAQSRNGHTADRQSNLSSQEDELMNLNELLEALAKFYGIKPELNAVKSATDGLIAALTKAATDGTPDPAMPDGAPMPDLAQLRSALGLAPDADNAAIVTALQAILDLLMEPETPPVPEGASAGKSTGAKFDFTAMKRAQEMAAKNAPAEPDDVPYNTRSQNGNGGQATRHAPAFNRGAKKPGLAELVLGVVGKKSEGAMKAMGYSTGPNGGLFLGSEVAGEMIELFRAQSVVDQLGATYVPMTGIETLTYRKQLGGATATYRGEAQNINQSEPQFGTVQLQLKELVAGTRVNRRLLRNSVANLEAMIRKDLQIAISLRADKAGLMGSGGIPNETGATGAEPTGLLNTAGVTQTALATNGAVPAIKDFVNAWGRIEDANVPSSSSWGMAMSPRTKRTMENLTDTTGQLLPVARWSQGFKYPVTTQIPNNLTVGTSTDCSEVFLGDWQYLIVGLGQDVEIIVDESVYRLSGEIYIEATMMHDVGVAQPTAFQILTGVRA